MSEECNYECAPVGELGLVFRGGGGGGLRVVGMGVIGVCNVSAWVYNSSSEEDGDDSGESDGESKGFGGIFWGRLDTSGGTYIPFGCSR